MSYSYEVHRSIRDVDAGTWQGICALSGGKLSQDIRLIASLEKSLAGISKFWHLVFYDEAAQPQACATLFTMTVDLAGLVDRRLASVLRRLPGPLRNMRYVPVLLCGLPIDVGEQAISMAPAADPATVLRLLDEAMTEIARQEKAQVAGLKEFTAAELPAIDGLLQRGYQRVPTLRNYVLWSDHCDFASYLAALRRGYRWEVKKSLRLLEEGGARVRILQDPDEIAETYTDDLHSLYVAVSDKAEFKLEVLPRQFFIELSRNFCHETALILIERDHEVLGFLWTVEGADFGYLLQLGMNYEAGDDIDLYFNLLYAGLGHCFSRGLSDIVLGQTADQTKARLGGSGFPLYAYMKGVGFPFAFILKHGLGLLTPSMPDIPHYRVFREDAHAEAIGAAAAHDSEGR